MRKIFRTDVEESKKAQKDLSKLNDFYKKKLKRNFPKIMTITRLKTCFRISAQNLVLI